MVLSLYGQNYDFRHYEVESGLSNNAVICSVQDKLGFMWFGTRDGINRFDGNKFKVYRFTNNIAKISGNNYIHALHVDRSGALLAGSEKELYRYDAKLDSFILLVSSPHFPIDEITSDSKGNIWFNAGNVLSKYSEKTKHLKTYDPKKYFEATSVSIDKHGALWVSTAGGFLKKYNEAGDNFSSYDLYVHSTKRSNSIIYNIQCTDDGKVLVGTNKGGFKIFYTDSNVYKDIPLCSEKTENLFIRNFLQVSTTELWIGSETGIFIYDHVTGKSKKVQKSNGDPYALSDNVVYTFTKDKEGGIWVGTYFGGINYYPKQFTPFQKFYHKPRESSLSGNIVREIREDKYGNIWVGTEDGGLNKLDAKTAEFSHFQPDQTKQSISYICVHDLLAVEDELWAGTYEHGLDILNIQTGKVVRHYDASSKTGLRSNFPFCQLITPEGEIIVGTTSGIYRYSKNKDYFEPLPGFSSNLWFMCMLYDKQGTLWAGIPGLGVQFVNKKNGQAGTFRHDPTDATSISSDKVTFIFEDGQDNIWFATENGLSKWNPATRNFKRYGTNNGFPSNFMLAILEDEEERLWISTTQGLTCFDPAREKTQVYTTANGLLSDQFNFSSAFKDKNGRMYFGSAKGLVRFHPAEFKQDNFTPPVFLTGLQINNQDVKIAQDGSPLKQSLSYSDKITLNNDQSTFSIDFTALGYTAPQNLEFAYILDGLSSKWTYGKGNRRANFTKLKPGTYIFRVKASSSSGIWNKTERKLTIEILPPWWASGMAFTTYVVLALLLVYYLFQNYHKRIEIKNRRKIELLEIAKEKEIIQLEMAKEKEMLESKIEFFTHVAHEIRTPLTLIKIPLAKLIRKLKGNQEVEDSLGIINRNSTLLVQLTNQLLDFRQLEINKFQLSFKQFEITTLVQEACSGFATLAEENSISLSLHLPKSQLYAMIDVDAFNKIIYNIFSNAVKYAENKISISLHPRFRDNHSFTIQVKNDGYLIPEPLREKIFEPFYRIKESEVQTGTGIGLALASSLALLHNGCLTLEPSEDNMNVFSLTLPLSSETENRLQANTPNLNQSTKEIS